MTNHELSDLSVPESIDHNAPDISNEHVVEEPFVPQAILSQRAIIASETYWLGGLKNSSEIHGYEDRRYSRYMEP